MPNDDLESRVTSLEHDVVRLREQVALTHSDAAAARVLAAGADHDVSEVRAELRAHTQGLNALREIQLEFREIQLCFRETQLEQSRELARLRQDLDAQGQELAGLRQEMRESLATLTTGMADVATLLAKITETEDGG